MKKIYIATSGYSYSSWKSKFYPEGLPSSRWLAYYSSRFNSVELNSTFYRFPVIKSLRKIYDATPADFIVTVKAHKIITHTMRLKDSSSKVLEFIGIVNEGLNEKLGCILFQLPPSFKYTEENLDHVLRSLPSSRHHVVEFRHASWWNGEVIDALRKHKLSICSVSFPNLPEDFHATTETFYLRMHGVPELFKSSYSDEELKSIPKKIPASVKECFIYFNNTMFEAGYSNALSLKALMCK